MELLFVFLFRRTAELTLTGPTTSGAAEWAMVHLRPDQTQPARERRSDEHVQTHGPPRTHGLALAREIQSGTRPCGRDMARGRGKVRVRASALGLAG